MSNSIVVWGRTLASTGGMFGFLGSMVYWFGVSGQFSLQEIVYGASLTFGCLLGIAATLVPWVRNKVRGGIILRASLFILPVSMHRLDLVGAISLLSVLLLFWWVALLLVGGILVLLSPQSHDGLGVGDAESS